MIWVHKFFSDDIGPKQESMDVIPNLLEGNKRAFAYNPTAIGKSEIDLKHLLEGR